MHPVAPGSIVRPVATAAHVLGQRGRALALARQAPRCYARTRAGGLCQNPACAGRRRCRMHGGRARGGVAHPRFSHGRATIEARVERRDLAALLRACRQTLGELRA